jgi:hypothetical protein
MKLGIENGLRISVELLSGKKAIFHLDLGRGIVGYQAKASVHGMALSI